MVRIFQKFRKEISRNVLLLGLISGLNDISSEMLYPIVPIVLTQLFGVSVFMIGIMEGFAEATASIFKVYFGYWSDRLQKRKPFIVSGYGASAVAKIIIALSTSWVMVYIGKILDRTGKGARTGARDALLLEASAEKNKGFIFGFHRSMDSLGAVIGPIIVLIILYYYHNNLRLILYLAMIPTIIALFFFFFVKESRKKVTTSKISLSLDISHLSATFKWFLLGYAIFSLGNSSDTFLILRAKSLGLNIFLVTAAYVVYNIVYTAVSTPAGLLADKIGAKKVFLTGIIMYIAVYAGFAFNADRTVVWILFAVYGCYIAFTDGVARAITSQFITKDQSATAYGVLYTVSSVAGLFASIIGGILWSAINPSATFIFAIICAGISLLILVRYLVKTPTVSPETQRPSAVKNIQKPHAWYQQLGLVAGMFILFMLSIGILYIVQKQFPPKVTRITAPSMTGMQHQKFVESPYAPYAYKVAPGQISIDAKQALMYFSLREKKLPDKTIQVDIKPVFKGYVYETFLVKPGYTFYIATTPDPEGDINDAYDFDFLQYDYPVLVDDKGYIVNL